MFGWLKVKESIKTYEEAIKIMDEYKLYNHPHITEEAFNKRLNLLFTPEKWLFEDLKIPGCGYFSRLNDSLLLSNSKQSYKSEWKLPSIFYKNLSQVFKKSWNLTSDGFCTVRTGIGQEFITTLSSSMENWLRELFQKNINNIFLR